MSNILTPTGYRPIADIAVGDEVCAFDVVTGAPIVNTVLAKELYTPARFARVEEEVVLVPAENSNYGEAEPELVESIEQRVVTSPMLFYTLNGQYTLFADQSVWKDIAGVANVTHASLLQVGDTVYDEADQPLVITSIAVSTGSEWYRLEISGDHSYVSDGLTLHNASRFWVGGTGSWDASTTTNWSTGTGGAGGASAPTSVDDATFDSASNATAYTVTTNAGAVCANLTMGAPASGKVTWAGSGTLSLWGNLNLSGGTAGITRSYTGGITFSSTATGKTITSNGVTFGGSFTVQGVGGGWQLQDGLTLSNLPITISAGAFDFNGQTCTLGQIVSNTGSATTRSIALGAANITLNSASSVVALVAPGGLLTFNCGTSTLTCTSSTGQVFTGGGNTFYNVTVTGMQTGNSCLMMGANTFNNLTFSNPVSTQPLVTTDSSITVTGTFTATGNTAVNRTRFTSSVVGATRTITAAAVSLTDVDFQDITGAGAATWSGTRLGDMGGNSGITLATAVPKFWVGGTGNTNDPTNHWATSSGGSPGVNNYPLPQDDVTFDASSNATAYTVTFGSIVQCANFSISAPGTSGTVTWAGSSALWVGGNFTLLSGMTRTYTGAITFGARATGKTIDTKAVTLTSATTWDGPGGAWSLSDVWNVGSPALTLNNGTLTTNSKTVTCGSFFSTTTTGTRALDMSGSTIAVGGAGTWSVTGSLSLTVDTSSTITDSAVSPLFNGGGLTYNDVSFTSSALTTPSVSNPNTYRNLSFTGWASASTNILFFSGNQTVTGTLTIPAGTAAAQHPLIKSDVAGTTRTLTVAAISALTDLDFSDITAAGASGTWSGTRLGDAGGNSNITFATPKTVYYVGNTANWNGTVWATSSGGAGAANNFPLPQDTSIFDANSFSANSQTVTMSAVHRIGAVDWSAITKTGITWAMTSGPTIFGDVVLKSTLTLSGAAQTFAKRSTQNLTSAGVSYTGTVTFQNVGGGISFQDNFTTIGSSTLQWGTMDLNGKVYTALALTMNVANVRGIKDSIGGGKISTTISTTANAFQATNATNLTIDRTNPWTIEVGGNTTNTRTFVGPTTGTASFPAVTFTNTTPNGRLNFSGTGSTFKSLAYTGGAAQTFGFTAGTTTNIEDTNGMAVGTSGNLLSIVSITAGTQATLNKVGGGAVQVDYANITDINATPPQSFYAPPATSTLVSNDTGWAISPNHPATGALAALAATIAGTAARGTVSVTHAATAALTAQAPAVAGSAQRTRQHLTTASLVGPGAALAGSSARAHLHPTSGALTALAATVAGLSHRTRDHLSTASLTGPGAALAGAASKFHGHVGSGALVAAAGALAASAHRTRVHPSVAALVGPGAALAAAAHHKAIHHVTAVLAGPGAVLAGSAVLVSIFSGAATPWHAVPRPAGWAAEMRDTVWVAAPRTVTWAATRV